MTYKQLFDFAEGFLYAAGNEAPKTDVRELMEFFLTIDGLKLRDVLNEAVDADEEREFLAAVRKRAEGYPLQYILKSWSFMDCDLSVGEGVLIPRDDTEVCVRECMRLIDESGMTAPVIIDLCSGSGAIAIALAKKYSQAHIIAVELSEKAYGYLCENIKTNDARNVYPMHEDIFDLYKEFEDGYFDVIISNPPYVRSDVIPTLQKEVQFEPKEALDGGDDGLVFYRAICEKWLPKLKSGGIVSLEIGEEQGKAVSDMLIANGASDVRIIKDIQDLDRAAVCN